MLLLRGGVWVLLVLLLVLVRGGVRGRRFERRRLGCHRRCRCCGCGR